MEQLTLEHAFRLRDQAMDRVEQHAGPTFKDRACDFVLAYLEQYGPTSSEELTDACCGAGIVPPDTRAFGPVYRTLSRRKMIHKVGACCRKRGHGTAGGNIWDRGPE